MQPDYFSIAIFRNALEGLCRKEKFGYISCIKDICDFFHGKNFEEVWSMNTRLREIENIRLIKIRLQNSQQHLSSADGFRLIICSNKKDQSVCFLNIYPKRGKLGQLDQGKEAYKIQLKAYL
jgi:hypothetical protein